MAIGVMSAASQIIPAVVGGLSGSSSNQGDANSKGFTTNAPLNLFGAGGDPAGFLFNRVQYKKNEKYQKSQDAIANAFTKAQTEAIKLQTQLEKDKSKRQNRIRDLVLGYK